MYPTIMVIYAHQQLTTSQGGRGYCYFAYFLQRAYVLAKLSLCVNSYSLTLTICFAYFTYSIIIGCCPQRKLYSSPKNESHEGGGATVPWDTANVVRMQSGKKQDGKRSGNTPDNQLETRILAAAMDILEYLLGTYLLYSIYIYIFLSRGASRH